ncbi:hypothetical protein MJG53_007886 [Ovis ammon polii x Ovis aries]|uniref:Uncharacterized protein n=1 Tax=Ovis ammon polii x Ovis aries TaxID=2918886 RepID=A0ACB9V4C3_9CETA|nr:hypothetical protein MJG53_007886 [Ovis ammon polii x Ovis aries]
MKEELREIMIGKQSGLRCQSPSMEKTGTLTYNTREMSVRKINAAHTTQEECPNRTWQVQAEALAAAFRSQSVDSEGQAEGREDVIGETLDIATDAPLRQDALESSVISQAPAHAWRSHVLCTSAPAPLRVARVSLVSHTCLRDAVWGLDKSVHADIHVGKIRDYKQELKLHGFWFVVFWDIYVDVPSGQKNNGVGGICVLQKVKIMDYMKLPKDDVAQENKKPYKRALEKPQQVTRKAATDTGVILRERFSDIVDAIITHKRTKINCILGVKSAWFGVKKFCKVFRQLPFSSTGKVTSPGTSAQILSTKEHFQSEATKAYNIPSLPPRLWYALGARGSRSNLSFLNSILFHKNQLDFMPCIEGPSSTMKSELLWIYCEAMLRMLWLGVKVLWLQELSLLNHHLRTG